MSFDPDFDVERYISLATYRKNGKEVATPVWFAQDGDRLFVVTGGDSGKVKRLRNSSRSRIAVCDMRGNVRGEWIPTETRIVDDQGEIATALRLLRGKYGVQFKILDLSAWLGRRIDQRAFLEIRPNPEGHSG